MRLAHHAAWAGAGGRWPTSLAGAAAEPRGVWPACAHGTAAPRAAQGKGGIPTGPGPAAEGIGSVSGFKYSSIQVFVSIQVFKYLSIQVFKYSSLQVFKVFVSI